MSWWVFKLTWPLYLVQGGSSQRRKVVSRFFSPEGAAFSSGSTERLPVKSCMLAPKQLCVSGFMKLLIVQEGTYSFLLQA